MQFEIPSLPLRADIETKAVLKQLVSAHRYLVLLNGKCATIPNEQILINTLALQEAKESSAIENIITTHDELYKAQLIEHYFDNAAAKEVSRYAEALKQEFQVVRRNKLLTNTSILRIQRALEQKMPATAEMQELF